MGIDVDAETRSRKRAASSEHAQRRESPIDRWSAITQEHIGAQIEFGSWAADTHEEKFECVRNNISACKYD